MCSRIIILASHSALRRSLFVICLSVSFNSILWTQFESFSQEWRWANFTMESGLPSNEVSDVVESPEGTAWAATSLGIAWFDGFQWHAVSDPDGAFRKRPQVIVAGYDSTIFAVFDYRLYRASTRG